MESSSLNRKEFQTKNEKPQRKKHNHKKAHKNRIVAKMEKHKETTKKEPVCAPPPLTQMGTFKLLSADLGDVNETVNDQ